MSIAVLQDGFVYAGQTDVGGGDAKLVRLNENGDVLWDSTYGGSATDGFSSVRATQDGGFIVAGATRSSGAGEYDAWVVKLNSQGQREWERVLGGSSNEGAADVIPARGGGYLVVAGADVGLGGAGAQDAWVIKLSYTGDVLWQRAYGGVGWDGLSSVDTTADGGFIVAGSLGSGSFGLPAQDSWLLKLRTDGSLEWARSYDTGVTEDFASSVRATSDGRYLVAGGTSLPAQGRFALFRLQANGEIASTCPAAIGRLIPSGDPLVSVGNVGTTVGTQRAATSSGTNAAFTPGQVNPTVETLCEAADLTPPTINIVVDQTLLWPPNHKMRMVAHGISATDAIDPNPTLSVTVTSNEPIDGLGDGDTAPDWTVTQKGDGSYTVAVRAERSGQGTGRTYTIVITATDQSGNMASQTLTVDVPHSL